MSKFRISVKTSDRFGAGSDAHVYIRLHDKNGGKSKPLRLDSLFKDEFERNQLDRFDVRTDKQLGKITDIQLWRHDSLNHTAEWHLEYVSVEDLDTNMKVEFPFHRWIKAAKHYFIEAYDSSLPQHAKFHEDRKEELKEKQETYQYKTNYPNLPLQIKDLPGDEKFSDTYRWSLALRKVDQLVQDAWVAVTCKRSADFDSLDDVFKIFGYYSNMPIPKDSERWREDIYFGHQRINGCNPKLIQLCRAIPENFDVDAEVLKPLLEGKTVEDAITAKKLFIIDLTIHEGIPTKNGAVLTTPYCLLYLRDNGDLVPVAIQLFKTPGPENPVFYPSDDKNLWTLAKMWYCLADSNYHQATVHLGGTHIIMEGLCIAANRHLSLSHPVYKLLAPHFLFLLAINTTALGTLVAPGAWVDQTMTIGRVGLLEQVARYYSNPDFAKVDLINDLERRGVDDKAVLPNYHYRDDATLVYGIIKNYVTRMVKLFYKTEQDMIDDYELQNWAKEIVAPKPEGLGCINVPGNGRFTTHDHLISLVTFIICSCSVEHAAFNFSQYDSYAFIPAYPAYLRGSPPKTKDPVTEDDIVKCFGNKEHAMKVMLIVQYLSERGTNHLGDFEVSYHHHPEALKIVEQFRSELKRATTVVANRDSNRRVPYEILSPDVIPNSISI